MFQVTPINKAQREEAEEKECTVKILPFPECLPWGYRRHGEQITNEGILLDQEVTAKRAEATVPAIGETSDNSQVEMQIREVNP